MQLYVLFQVLLKLEEKYKVFLNIYFWRGGQRLSSGLENRRPYGVTGSNPVLSAIIQWRVGRAVMQRIANPS